MAKNPNVLPSIMNLPRERCPGCGYLVPMPCLKCQAEIGVRNKRALEYVLSLSDQALTKEQT